METYLVKKPIIHDGKTYSPGESVDLGDFNAGFLLATGEIAREPMPESPAKTTKKEERKKI
jgi:hypothetical protein